MANQTNENRADDPAVDLTQCEREQIHLLGGIQSYGCLIATSTDFMISHVSDNVDALLGVAPGDMIGSRLMEHLPEQTVHDLRTKLQLISSTKGTSARLFGYPVMADDRVFDVSVHMSGPTYIFEFEPKTNTENRDEMALVQPLIARVSGAADVNGACKQAAMSLQVLSGFDRVMVYKFHEDHSGEVIAEYCNREMEPFLGLRYPASDIPPQARALYKRSTLRLIADVDGKVSSVVPQSDTTGNPLDLSLAVTRAVSPIHLEYLRNMGVAASMSVSILQDGELWGLFACHHNTPHYVDYERRTAIELFAKFFSYELGQKIEQESRSEDRNSRRLHDNLMIQLSGGTDLVNGFDIIADELAGLVASDGVAVYSNGRYVSRGVAPSKEEFVDLVRFLNTSPTDQVFASAHLTSLYPEAAAYVDKAAGMMAVPISRSPRDYIAFFRREIARSVKWAGNPNKPVELGPDGSRLTPRKSFEAWNEVVRGTSQPWSMSELRVAEALRISLIEIVLKLTDEANEARSVAADKQDLLIAELNHRVRNILNLIQGLVSQSRTGSGDIASYTKVLDGRIQALARAHDQLTRQEWEPSSLRQLIDVEVIAYLNGQEDRFKVSGAAPMLEPEAFSTMALVIHELVTNSAKYGALTDNSGSVHVDLELAKDGALHIKWREHGGPQVKAPKRRGFGTTIIENTIPFELKGKVETRYPPGGFEADIVIPSTSISDLQEEARQPVPVTARPQTKGTSELSGTFLVVEDNMVIALDTSQTLEHAGAAKVHMASNVDDALSILADNPITLAVLDVNLGAENSLAIAQWLAEHDIPFLLATGYGDSGSITQAFPSAEILNKPYSGDVLIRAIARALDPGTDT